MKKDLIDILCDPADQSELELCDEVAYPDGTIESGVLVSKRTRSRYPIVNGIPRFVDGDAIGNTVKSFGAEWNYFNYDLFKINWLNHVVVNTFGTPSIFKGKIVVDCGAGSGMQSRWMAELGAERVIALELSNSVDHVMKANLAGVQNVDVIQCSIDNPPLKKESIDGIVICHNVIQHTPSVERTANALWGIVGKGGEFVFNCYMKYPNDPICMVRWHLVYRPLRAVLSRCSFKTILFYARVMGLLRFVPGLGWILEKGHFLIRGNVPKGPNFLRRQWKSTLLNTYDLYGFHEYQHHKTEAELRKLISELQSDPKYVKNLEVYFARPMPPGIAFRITKA